jgi:predicted RNase H-like HicB family nuclease
MKFFITIFRDEDGVFIAECPSIPGCISQGKTEQEAESNIREAIKECLEVCVCKDFRNGYNTLLWLNC